MHHEKGEGGRKSREGGATGLLELEEEGMPPGRWREAEESQAKLCLGKGRWHEGMLEMGMVARKHWGKRGVRRLWH